jgi:hypothetical protein
MGQPYLQDWVCHFEDDASVISTVKAILPEAELGGTGAMKVTKVQAGVELSSLSFCLAVPTILFFLCGLACESLQFQLLFFFGPCFLAPGSILSVGCRHAG